MSGSKVSGSENSIFYEIETNLRMVSDGDLEQENLKLNYANETSTSII
jgi:hypothetical protein